MHCIENEVSGGFSTLVDGFKVAEHLKKYNNKSKIIKNAEIAITLITPRAIGYNVLKKNQHDKYMAGLNSKDI